MFDFEKLTVYQKIKVQNTRILKLIYRRKDIDPYLKDQWKRATLSVAINIAEGTGRVGKSEKKYFYAVARSSVHECVAIVDILKSAELLELELLDELYKGYEEVSKMLLCLYRSVGK